MCEHISALLPMKTDVFQMTGAFFYYLTNRMNSSEGTMTAQLP